jgi:diguanylate cyclase (GGDEF)-like protein/PAS domain S-box-containing protein
VESQILIDQLDKYLQKIIERGIPDEGFHYPLDPESIESEKPKQLSRKFQVLFEMMNEACEYSEQLAKGNLKVTASRNNVFTMPMKGLQASLAHLIWQVNQVAEGDLNQQVSFLGEFSASFNHMIESLREKQALEERLKVITDVLGEGLLFVDTRGTVLFANPEALSLLKITPDEIKGETVTNIFFRFSTEKNFLLNCITKGLNYDENNGVLINRSGEEIPVMISGRPVYKNKNLDGTVITFRDITEQKKYLQSLETINKLLEKQAKTDALTGIFNRMKFDEILAKEIQRSKRNRVPLSLIICDIDHFKIINDQYGHQAGDKVLKRLTRLISTNIRSIDFFARWGGEEFVILSPGTDINGAEILAEKIRKKVESHIFSDPEHLTLSFGVASYRTGDNAAKLINRADEAMYEAKENGRNRVQVSN